MRTLIATLTLVALSACTLNTGEPPVAGTTGYTCRSDMLAQFTGSVATQQLGVDIQTAAHARTIRWVPKGGVVTMDFRADRATVYLDGDGKVERASCG